MVYVLFFTCYRNTFRRPSSRHRLCVCQNLVQWKSYFKQAKKRNRFSTETTNNLYICLLLKRLLGKITHPVFAFHSSHDLLILFVPGRVHPLHSNWLKSSTDRHPFSQFVQRRPSAFCCCDPPLRLSSSIWSYQEQTLYTSEEAKAVYI